ncbi:prepilin peptidase [bacterium]|nr:prepilin peptidase [bacterium]
MTISLVKLLLGFPIGLLFAGVMTHLVHVRSLKLPLAAQVPICPSCGKYQGLISKIPVLGYVLYGRKCSHCNHKLSWKEPVSEILTILFTMWAFSSMESLVALQLSMLFFALLGITIVDFSKWRIPNLFVMIILLVAVVGIASGIVSLDHSLKGIGVALVTSILLVIPQKLVNPELDYAWGDVKLCFAVALWLGWILSIYVFFLASLGAVLVWVFSGLKAGYSANRPLQFGPFVALSTMIFGIGRVLHPQFITDLLTFRF